jgi:uncharacterized membrane protein (DUF373 family)
MHGFDRMRLDRPLRILVTTLEVLTMAVLALLILLALAGLMVQIVRAFAPPFLAGEQITGVLDNVLAVFVLIELLATASAFLHRRDVTRRMFETIFVAIARKLITLELTTAPLEKAIAVGVLLVAAGTAWLLVARAKRQWHTPPPAAAVNESMQNVISAPFDVNVQHSG